jgi:hypothetical protein
MMNACIACLPGDVAAKLLSSEPLTHGPIIEVRGTDATVWARGSAAGLMRVTCRPSNGDSTASPRGGSYPQDEAGVIH